jgi:hypothetical protein
MNSQHYFQKAKDSARNQLILVVFCLEFLLVLAVILWGLTTGSLFVFITGVCFCIFVPIVGLIEWRKEIEKSKTFHVNPTIHSIPYSPKVNLPGAELNFEPDKIFLMYQKNNTRKVEYLDIKSAELTWNGAYILKLARRSGLLSLDINLSLCQKEDWQSILEIITSRSPDVTLNDLASEIRNGQIPYF